MVRHLVFQLADRLANTATYDVEGQFLRQKEELQRFGDDLGIKLGMIVREMESDIGLLRERGFNRGMQKILIKLWNDILGIYKKMNVIGANAAAKEFLAYATSKHVRDVIDNLDFLAEHHLQNTNIDLSNIPTIRRPRIRSLGLIKRLVHHIENYFSANPPITAPTLEVPDYQMETAPSLGEEEKTNLGGKPRN